MPQDAMQLFVQLFAATIGENQSETPIHTTLISELVSNWLPPTVAANS